MVTTAQSAHDVAAGTPDPELPQLTIGDLGILRRVEHDDGRLVVTITPTYSGCPALREIRADLDGRLRAAGFADVTIATELAPPWTSAMDHRRRPRQARRRRNRPAGHPAGRVGSRPADLDGCPAVDTMPALRLAAHRAHRRVQRHRVQVAAPVHRLQRALRVDQDDLMAPREFHLLTVARVDRLTDDSTAVTFAVPEPLRATFAFAPGQSLTVRRGTERRSYSICAPAGRSPRIGVRRVAGGILSGWLVDDVRPGDVVEAQPPSGSFTPDLTRPARHVFVAAGSGITPVLSMAASVLQAHRESTVTLVYANRRADTVMFADEIADLKDAHPDRCAVVHVLSREPREVELFNGRLDAAKLRELLPAVVGVRGIDHWWLCGPLGMVEAARDVLGELGVDGARVHRELFYVEDTAPPQVQHADAPVGPGATVTVQLDGRSTTVVVPAGVAVLDAAQRVRPDLPFACKGGVCGTCRARVTEGEVRMRRNYALEPDEVDAGFVLTCQALPVSGPITVDYDA